MRGRWLWIALAVSLAVNLFVAGVWLGGRLHGGEGHEGRRHAAHGPSVALAELPPEQRRALRQAMRGAFKAARPDAERARVAREGAARAVAAEPFDRAAAEAALAEVRAREAAVRVRVETAMLDYAAGLPPEQRAVVGEAVARGLGGRRGGPKRP